MGSMTRKSCDECGTKPAFWFKRDTRTYVCRDHAAHFNKETPKYRDTGMPICLPVVPEYKYTPLVVADGSTPQSKNDVKTHRRIITRIVALSQTEFLIHYNTDYQENNVTTIAPFHNWIVEVNANV